MTLPEITTDILKIIRSSNVSKDETISLRQVEDWVHEFRAEYIMRARNKGDKIDRAWMQPMKCLALEIVDKAECELITLDSNCDILRTTLEVPPTIRYGSGSGMLSIGSVQGKPYQIATELRGHYQKYRPYSFNDRIAWHIDNYVYVTGDHGLKYISLRGLFANPVDLSTYINNCSDTVCYNIDTQDYPASQEMRSFIRDMIMEKIMRITIEVPSDKSNDSQNILSPNISP